LGRLQNLDEVDLIIFDEFSNFLSHVQNSEMCIKYFLMLHKKKCTQIFMDSLISEGDVKIIEKNGQDTFVINNKYKPYEGKKVHIFPLKNERESTGNTESIKISKFVLQKLYEEDANGHVLVSCQSLKKAERIYKYILGNSNIKEEEVCFYHGDNFKVEKDELHITRKKRETLDVNESWKNAKIVLYTGCISSGIDFSLFPFTTFIGVLGHGSGNVDFFVQSLFRV